MIYKEDVEMRSNAEDDSKSDVEDNDVARQGHNIINERLLDENKEENDVECKSREESEDVSDNEKEDKSEGEMNINNENRIESNNEEDYKLNNGKVIDDEIKADSENELVNKDEVMKNSNLINTNDIDDNSMNSESDYNSTICSANNPSDTKKYYKDPNHISHLKGSKRNKKRSHNTTTYNKTNDTIINTNTKLTKNSSNTRNTLTDTTNSLSHKQKSKVSEEISTIKQMMRDTKELNDLIKYVADELDRGKEANRLISNINSVISNVDFQLTISYTINT